MVADVVTFLANDDPHFISLASGYLAKEAPARRGLTPDSYIEYLREKWHLCAPDQVYALKMLIDPIADPSLADEFDGDVYCILVARLNAEGELLDAKAGYEPPSCPRCVLLRHIVAGAPVGATIEEPNASEPANYLFAYFDILGFEALLNRIGLVSLHEIYSRLIENVVLPQANRRWSKSLSMVSGSLTDALMYMPVNTAHASDSICIWTLYHPQYVGEFLNRCAIFFCESLRLGLPLRGIVTAGEAILCKQTGTFLGTPLVRCARAEKELDWIGVAIANSPELESLRIPVPPELIMLYDPPTSEKGKALLSGAVLDWPKIWRSRYEDDAGERLTSLCGPELSQKIQNRYKSAVGFVRYSQENENWFLPEGVQIERSVYF